MQETVVISLDATTPAGRDRITQGKYRGTAPVDYDGHARPRQSHQHSAFSIQISFAFLCVPALFDRKMHRVRNNISQKKRLANIDRPATHYAPTRKSGHRVKQPSYGQFCQISPGTPREPRHRGRPKTVLRQTSLQTSRVQNILR